MAEFLQEMIRENRTEIARLTAMIEGPERKADMNENEKEILKEARATIKELRADNRELFRLLGAPQGKNFHTVQTGRLASGNLKVTSVQLPTRNVRMKMRLSNS